MPRSLLEGAAHVSQFPHHWKKQNPLAGISDLFCKAVATEEAPESSHCVRQMEFQDKELHFFKLFGLKLAGKHGSVVQVNSCGSFSK